MGCCDEVRRARMRLAEIRDDCTHMSIKRMGDGSYLCTQCYTRVPKPDKVNKE